MKSHPASIGELPLKLGKCSGVRKNRSCGSADASTLGLGDYGGNLQAKTVTSQRNTQAAEAGTVILSTRLPDV